MLANGRKISRGLYGAILLCLFMPFITVSCGPQQFTLSGTQLITGLNYQGEHLPPQGTIIMVLLAALVGLGTSFLVSRRSLIAPLVAGVIGALMLLQFRNNVAQEVLESGGMLRATLNTGYWLSFLLNVAGAVLNGWLFTQMKAVPFVAPILQSSFGINNVVSPPPMAVNSGVQTTCPACGKPINPDARFCMECGTPVST